MISESEDGWYVDKDKRNDDDENRFEDISEHTSDEMTDSDPDEILPGG